MMTVSDIIGVLVALIFVFSLVIIGCVCFKREQERLLEESEARIEMYNAITDLCESWVESNGT